MSTRTFTFVALQRSNDAPFRRGPVQQRYPASSRASLGCTTVIFNVSLSLTEVCLRFVGYVRGCLYFFVFRWTQMSGQQVSFFPFIFFLLLHFCVLSSLLFSSLSVFPSSILSFHLISLSVSLSSILFVHLERRRLEEWARWSRLFSGAIWDRFFKSLFLCFLWRHFKSTYYYFAALLLFKTSKLFSFL